MASAFKDKTGWVADYRGPHAPPKRRRRTRVPAAVIANAPDPRAAALLYAQECERLARLLESSPMPTLIHQALEMGVINDEQADALDNSSSALKEFMCPSRPLTILEAFQAHPSTIKGRHTAECARHQAHLEEFCKRYEVELASKLTLDLVMQWARYLERERRYAPDSIRHALIGLRRASRIAGSRGLPDPLTGFQLLRRATTPDVLCWDPVDLCKGLLALQAAEDHRATAVLALGGFMGLRPSEICRLQVGDIKGDVVRVGLRAAKNRDSRRDLPMPEIVAQAIAPLLTNREPGAPLIAPNSAATKAATVAVRPFALSSLTHLLSPPIAAAIGSPGTIKHLRKSFASWAVDVLPVAIVEDFMGHRHSGVAAVTARHYLGKSKLAKLRPHAEKMNEFLSECLQEAKKTEAKALRTD